VEIKADLLLMGKRFFDFFIEFTIKALREEFFSNFQPNNPCPTQASKFRLI